MKKLLLSVLALVMVFSLVACGEKKVEQVPETNVQEQNTQTETTPVVNNNEEEQVGVGNTDESMVVLALEQYIKSSFGDAVEEVNVKNVKVYSKEEIENDEAIKSHNIGENDIAFEAEYELKIVEGYEDMNSFTAGTGEVDGQWIRNKFNVGIARDNGEAGYTIDAFGTGF